MLFPDNVNDSIDDKKMESKVYLSILLRDIYITQQQILASPHIFLSEIQIVKGKYVVFSA